LSKIVIFATGAAIGSFVTYKLLKTKYEQLAQEEIDSVIATFRGDIGIVEEDDYVEVNEPDVESPEMREYADVLVRNKYVNYSDNKKEEVETMEKPCVIPPDEFGDIEEYAKIELTYYADGYLTDDQDALVEDVDGTVGYDSLECFGEWEDDAVHVRNDRLKAYFEILADVRDYADIRNSRPYPTED
jgi:hypothetical protein